MKISDQLREKIEEKIDVKIDDKIDEKFDINLLTENNYEKDNSEGVLEFLEKRLLKKHSPTYYKMQGNIEFKKLPKSPLQYF